MMIRTVALAAMSAPLAAVIALYAITRPPGTPLSATEEWPICSTMASLGASGTWAQLDPDFTAGKNALAAGDWVGAIALLKSAALRDTRNADIQNYIGYGHRRLRELEPAFAHFRRALTINPRHRAAHQHMGETYLTIGNLAAAEEHLAALERICLIPCNEHDDLQRAIAKYKASATQ
jgi:tetratricopeptide (TPR) repeat protein